MSKKNRPMPNVHAWHFIGDKLRNGRAVPTDGLWLVHDGECRMCESGLHASRRVLGALLYAPGCTICRVECDEIAEEDNNKLVCRRRRILWRVDAEECLRSFARWCALQVVSLWEPPCIVLDYLASGDNFLRAAAWAAARATAGDAAGAAAGAAARDAAWAAARDAARDAARAAAWATARDQQNDQLETMIREAHAGCVEWILEKP